MKSSNKLIWIGFVLFTFIMGCKKDEHTGASTLVKTNATVQIEGLPSVLVVKEDTAGVIVTVEVSLSEEQIVDAYIPVTVLSGTATEGVDFEVSTSELFIPAYTKGPVSFEVQVFNDDEIEEDETFSVVVGSDKVENVKITPAKMDVTIVNSISSDLNIEFDWSKDYNIEGEDFNTLEFVDLDFYVFDESGTDLEIYDAATGNAPELLTLNPDLLPEGKYTISASLYFNSYKLAGLGDTLLAQGPFPITSTFTRGGLLDPVSLVQVDSLAFNSNTSDLENDGVEFYQELFQIEVLPNAYIIYNIDGSKFINARKAKKHVNVKKHESNASLIR